MSWISYPSGPPPGMSPNNSARPGGLNDSNYGFYTTVPPYERTCDVYQQEQSDIQLSVGETVGIKIFWWILFLPGVLLNLMTVVAILRKKTLRNVISSRYTVALSLIDGTKILLVGLTVLTNLYTDGFLSRTNDFFCGVLMWLETWLKYSSLCMLGVIALDRYRMVNRAAKYMKDKRFRTSMAVGFLIPSVYVAVLCGLLQGTQTIQACYDKHLLMCLTILGPQPVDWILVTAFPLDTFLLASLQLILIVAYSAIVWTLIKKYQNSKAVRPPSAGPNTPSLPRTPQQQRNETYLHRASTRSAEMMVVVCLSCIITSIPVSLYNLVSFLFANESAVIKALESGDYKWIMWSYHISTAINPMIYAYFNTHLLTELKYLIRCKRSPRIVNKPSKIH